MTAPAIRTEGLTKRYGDLAAVDGLDLSVAAGEVFGFLGPNGAGKTTTIRLFLGLARPTAGRAEIFGLDVRRERLAINRRSGYLPSERALYQHLTGRELLRHLANLQHGDVDPAFVDELAGRLDADLSRRVGDLSTGNRQKIGLIQAFMHRPDLVVLDEPATGLDPLVQQSFHQLLAEVRADGRTVFLSSHTLSEVERVADRVGIIRRGRLVVVERVAELKRIALHRIDLDFAAPVPARAFDGVPAVRDVAVDGAHARVTYEGPVNDLLRAALEHELVEVHTREADLEEIFLTYYRDEPQGVR
jgi:ABC-2 type transport system ATP-binding protein